MTTAVADIANSAVFRLSYDVELGKQVFTITCSSCGATISKPHRGGVATMAPIQSARNKGWHVDERGREARCPSCERGTMKNEPSHKAMKQQVEMVRLLDAHFDADTGTYAPGWSDAAVARDTGLSPDAVAKFREAAFGELRDPVLDKLEADIAALRAKLDADINAAHELLDATAKETSDRIAEISRRFAATQIKRVA